MRRERAEKAQALEERSAVLEHMEKHKQLLVARTEVSLNGNFSFQERKPVERKNN